LKEGTLGWVAAVLELKGKVRRAKRPGGTPPQIVMRVQSTEQGLIATLGNRTGISSQRVPGAEATFSRKQCAEHCPEDHVHVTTPNSIGRWELSGAGLGVVLDNCTPFFTYRAEEFALLQHEIWASSPGYGRGSGAIMRSLGRLMGLGWDTMVAEEQLKQATR